MRSDVQECQGRVCGIIVLRAKQEEAARLQDKREKVLEKGMSRGREKERHKGGKDPFS